MTQQHSILNGNIEKSIVNMTSSIAVGFIGLFTFNTIDTYFISQLGSEPLAALSFTYPICFLFMNMFFGLNTGITSQVGKSLGQNKNTQAKHITFNSLIFTFLLSVIFSAIGISTIEYIFNFLGANTDNQLIIYINNYMPYWYLGFPLLVLAVSSGAAIRGQGDAKTPSRILLISSIINGILDPLLIFGLGPFPKFGITGAVMATTIAWLVAAILSIRHLIKKTHLLDLDLHKRSFHTDNIKNHFASNIKQVLHIGLPSMLTNAINPMAHSILIKIVALEGILAVAGFGVGIKLEAFATLFSIALSIAMVPFVSINHGAKQHIRITHGLQYAIKLAVIIQLIIYAFLFFSARLIANQFSDNPEIIEIIVLYLKIIPGAYCFIGIMLVIISALNAIERAKYSALINLIRFFIITIPLAYLGQYLYGFTGILIGIVLAKVFAVFVAFFIYKKVTRKHHHYT